MTDYPNYAELIKSIRKKMGMSQTQLAQLANTTQNEIYKLENEIGKPRISTLHRIAKALRATTHITIIPNRPIKDVVSQMAQKKAQKLAESINNSAALADRHVDQEVLQILAKKIKENIVKRKKNILWN
jgi:transcriptional regulator with XRE-family HTH domain